MIEAYPDGAAPVLMVSDAAQAKEVRRRSGGTEIGEHFLSCVVNWSGAIPNQAIVTCSPLWLDLRLPWSETSLGGYEDLRLFYHYTSKVARTFTLPGPVAQTWQESVPQLALWVDYIYLAHALLAVSAAYRFYQHPNDLRAQWKGFLHYGMCVHALGNLDLYETNASAALAATTLLTWYAVDTPSIEI
jgi:hypothetical protein